MAKELKRLIVEELTRQYADMERCVVVNLSGIGAETAVEIRRRLRDQNITLKVVKNSLVARAFKSVGLDKVVGLLHGPCAVATGGDDVVALARVMTDVARKAKIEIRGGFGEGMLLAPNDVKRFAQIPPRSALIAGFLSTTQGPLRKMVGTLGTFTRSFVCALDAVAKKRPVTGPG